MRTEAPTEGEDADVTEGVGGHFDELKQLLEEHSLAMQRQYTRALSQLRVVQAEHDRWLLQQRRRAEVELSGRFSPSLAFASGSPQDPLEHPAACLHVPQDDTRPHTENSREESKAKTVNEPSHSTALSPPTSAGGPATAPSSEKSIVATNYSQDYRMPHAVRSQRDSLVADAPDGSGHMMKVAYQVWRATSAARLRIQKAPESVLSRFVDSTTFKVITTFAILVNALCIGIEKDHMLTLTFDNRSLSDDEESEFWKGMEIFWCAFFSVELLIRALAEKLGFFLGKRWKWNNFDMVLVASSIFELSLGTYSESEAPDFQFARVIRLLRFTRVLRLLRAMRFSQSLRLMIFSILASLFSLFWVVWVLLFVIYFFGVFFMSGILEDYQRRSMDPWSTVTRDLLQQHFGSLQTTLISLFMCISGGRDWADVMDPLREIGELYVYSFIVFILFMTFGVLNVVTGHFVDSAAQVAAKDREAAVKNEMQQEKEYVPRMRQIFREADKDGNGTLSWEEFEGHLNEPTAAAYFATLGLDSTIAKTLFVLLDVNDTNSVSIDEFVGGCMRLKGTARSIDVNMLLYENEKMIVKIVDAIEKLGAKDGQVPTQIGHLRQGRAGRLETSATLESDSYAASRGPWGEIAIR